MSRVFRGELKVANRLIMQFHITGRCNLNCRHCYRTCGNTEPLSYNDVTNVIDQYSDLMNRYNRENHLNRKGQINITGGEPFIREDIFDIINYIGRRKLPFGLLTNGSFLTDRAILCLKRNKVSIVQLSIDGNCNTHDELRAKGDYERTFKVASKLEKEGIKTLISFTANKKNYKDLPSVADRCRKEKISKLWSDRLVPIGNGENICDLEITKYDMADYTASLKKAQGNSVTRALYPKTQVAIERALQFIYSDGPIYSCSAGDSLITVDENGQVMPCRRMPVVCGSIFDSSLEDIYYNSEVFLKLREKNIPEECKNCNYSAECRGGAKCQSYAKYKDFNRADPSCPLK